MAISHLSTWFDDFVETPLCEGFTHKLLSLLSMEQQR